MSQLFFKRQFLDAIRRGDKRTTIRRWSRPMVQAGKRVFSPGIGYLNIDAVDVVELHAMSDHDAIADGFATAAEMVTALQQFYPAHATDDKQWFRVKFRFDAPPGQKEPQKNAIVFDGEL